jgi:hypothetical protein
MYRQQPSHARSIQPICRLLPALLLAAATQLQAADTLLDTVRQGKPMTSFRLRYEYVDQQNLPETGEAITLRSLVGWQTAPYSDFSIGMQIIDVARFKDNYDERDHGLPQSGRIGFPIIVDPNVTHLNQLYVDWTGLGNTRLRVGRQAVNLDNVRFIGDIAFRQVMQVFDGVSLLNKSLPNTELYLAHFGRVRQISTRHREGDFDIVNARHHLSPTASLTGYGYFANFDNPTIAPSGVLGPNTDQSHKTLGLRLDGMHRINGNWQALYTAEYARQTDYADGDPRIDAHYLRLGGGVKRSGWTLRFDHETLSSNDGVYAFQTPFGTNHLFQGWADLFLITPRQGIQDNFLSFSGKPWGALQLLAEYHIIRSDEDGIDFGKELDLAVAYAINARLQTKIEYASFKEGDRLAGQARKPDTEKLWLTLIYAF